MFKLKNAALSLAVIMALAACGGSDDPVTPQNPPAQGDGNPPPADPGTDPTDPGTDPTDPGTDPTDPGTDPTTPPADATFEGDMTMANQVLFNNMGIDYNTFRTAEAFGIARGTYAPLQTFGLRVSPNLNMVANGEQSGNVRIAIELDEVAGGEDRLIQLLIDQATVTVNAAGDLAVSVPEAAQAHVVVRNAAGETSTVSAGGLAANTVRIEPIQDDPTSAGFTVDIDAAMGVLAAAATPEQLAALEAARDVEGRFNMSMTVTGLTILDPNDATTPLVGEAITVGDQPVVNGAGVTGVLRIGLDG